VGKSVDEAEELIERVDRDRAAFIRKYFDRTWPQRDLYDLMINTRIGDEAVIDLILRQTQLRERAPEPASVAG
jgi:hypothetical protein